MKKYANYLKEREGMELLESENGFAVYVVYPELDTLYLSELFVEKHVRGSLEAYKLFKECKKIARSFYCNNILGTVDISTLNYQYSESLMKRLGFHFEKKIGNLLYYKLKIVKL